jgi:hypothetical protein
MPQHLHSAPANLQEVTIKFGNQTAIVVSITEDTSGTTDRYGHPDEIRTETPVPGVRCRPLPATEKQDTGDVVTDPWKLTAPPVPAIVNAKAGDEIRVDGNTFQLTGLPRVFNDRRGPHKVTVTLSRNLG